MIDTDRIDSLNKILDGYRPLPAEIVENLYEDLVLRWTYHSNAIEGNTLTLDETRRVLAGECIPGKTPVEHQEALNHREAIHYIHSLIQRKEPLSEWQVKTIHQLVLKQVDDEHAGVYRSTNVIISGADHVPPEALQVPGEMQAFMSWYREQAQSLHLVQWAARIHTDFVGIHPFVDGNGRTARLLMNLELMRCGYPPVVIPVARRLEYYQALDHAHMTGDHSFFDSLLGELAIESFKPYWHALGLPWEDL